MTEGKDMEVLFYEAMEIDSRARPLINRMDIKDCLSAFDLVYDICFCLDQPDNSGTSFIFKVKHMVHKNKIALLCERDAELEQVESLWNENMSLGFQIHYDESIAELYFARYFARNNQMDRARSIVKDLFLNLEEYRQSNPPFYEEKKRACENVFKQNMEAHLKNKIKLKLNIGAILAFLESIVSCTQYLKDEKLAHVFDLARQIIFLLDISDDWKLEVKRQIAEIKLNLFTERGFSFDEIKKLYDEILELGFRDMEREASIQLFFSEYYIRQKKYEEARPILIELISKLDHAKETSEWKAGKIREIKATAEKHLSELPNA